MCRQAPPCSCAATLCCLAPTLTPPPPLLPHHARAHRRDPITYTFKALIPQQFQCTAADAAQCPKITTAVVLPSGSFTQVSVDRYAFVSSKYEVYAEEAWDNVGYLALFVVVFQLMAFWSLRYVRHISR